MCYHTDTAAALACRYDLELQLIWSIFSFFSYTPSQADVQVFEQVGKAPAASLAHALRWYNQIASYTPAERKAWAAGVSPLTAGGKPTTAPAPADDDDDDVDLFGSGDEEEVSISLHY